MQHAILPNVRFRLIGVTYIWIILYKQVAFWATPSRWNESAARGFPNASFTNGYVNFFPEKPVLMTLQESYIDELLPNCFSTEKFHASYTKPSPRSRDECSVKSFCSTRTKSIIVINWGMLISDYFYHSIPLKSPQLYQFHELWSFYNRIIV